jgi:hypothetical protein
MSVHDNVCKVVSADAAAGNGNTTSVVALALRDAVPRIRTPAAPSACDDRETDSMRGATDLVNSAFEARRFLRSHVVVNL